jgi:predicted DNA-binding transcriptional regulator AlpA
VAQRFIGIRQLHERLGAGRDRSTFRKWVDRAIRSGNFPPPVVLPGGRLRFWSEATIDQWIAAAILKAERTRVRVSA